MKRLLYAVLMIFYPLAVSQAAGQWEKQDNFYFLTKNTRDSFSATAAGANKFTSKYLTYDGIEFLVRGADGWNDYGRLNLEGNNMFSVPIRSGMKVDELHFLAGGNFGNSYEHDKLLRLYGDNYFYSVVSVIFAYQDGVYKSLSVPVFWDWFHLDPMEWSKDGARVRCKGNNPVRKDCSMLHISFTNSRPAVPVRDILVTDSWLSDRPFSEIFAVTLKSGDTMEATPKEDLKFKTPLNNAAKEPADNRTQWSFEKDLDGWITGSSENWSADCLWQADSYGRKGAVVIPACNWGGDKFSWMEKKIALPGWDKVEMQFLRHSALYSEQDKLWSDGLLRVIVKGASGVDTVYEKLYSGEWGTETADLSRYKGQTVVIRFEDHGGGHVRLSQTTSPACDGEDAIIDDIRLVKQENRLQR
ncbi:MAG: hypothetical protein NTU54_02465 [Candidatus Omnitrophica bacterium]|nr:hypothetical protein [Candidatus Omnitrophota bacterium]